VPILSRQPVSFTMVFWAIAVFLPQVALAITASLLGAQLARRISAKRVNLLGLACSITSMVLVLARTLVKTNHAAAYPLLLVATAFLGAGFGLTVPVLNSYTAVFNPGTVDRSVLTLNALLGLGTARYRTRAGLGKEPS
jgi:MFS family permease